MAFQQPQQRPQPSRPLSVPQQQPEPAPLSPARKRAVEKSQEWILFTPQNDGQSASCTSQTPRTATHLSDFGSLETHIKSQPQGRSHDEEDGGSEADEEAELDSLDDGLHAFHHPSWSAGSQPLDHSGGAVLPTHDGFGGFPGSSAALQEQLWQFERYNPARRNKHARRRSSVQRRLDILEEEEHLSPEDERTARIEKWRLEQSRAVLEEIERETRRRRRRLSRMSAAGSDVRRQSIHDALASRVLTRQDSVILEGPETEKNDVAQPSESFWRRITRKVIQDLIGLDETTLSVIFGEQLVEDSSPTPTQPSPIAAAAQRDSRVAFYDSEPTWEVKLLDRIARELGILVHQLSDFDGNAFTAYKNAQQQNIEYAGIPRDIPRQPPLRQRRRAEKARAGATSSEAVFTPTVPQSPLPQTEETDTSLWGIEEEPEEPADDETVALQQEREYWERDVDVKMIFSYLKNRFAKQSEDAPVAPAELSGPLPASWTTNVGASASALSTSPEGLRRAEIIKKQHPLVSRAAGRAAQRAEVAAAQTRRRESLLRRHQMQTLMQKRSSSCASQSTKLSRHSRSGSSRHYWDLGGSVGSHGSGPAMSSALGGWGEV
ncbi:hypothetical protein DOTSEDRAFT_64324 [Dothistroma septosporum NZE10]|uniref:Uncharacterized protein n=1 Tax=Dothistroma septosporum (strain NZE10 / CBS 128990) TaxID=675120 RepID=N1PK78_DOTSN|nr:hypothetical protein DOTSEDRAFT_64324 [Dothistroma septosporum NZE10]